MTSTNSLLSKVLHLSSVGLCISTLEEGRLLEVNTSFASLTGYTPEELIGQRVHDLRLWVDPSERETLVTALRESGSVRSIERRLRTKSGEVRTAIISYDLVHLEGQDCILTVLEDVTNLRRAEHILEQWELTFRHFFFNSPYPMWLYDPTTLKMIEVNPAAVRHYGYSRDEFLSMKITDFRPPEDVERLLADVERLNDDIVRTSSALQSGNGWRHIRKDGSIINVQILAHTVDVQGQKLVFVLAEDVTEHVEAQKALRETASRLQAVFAASPISIFAYDLDGVVTMWNRAAERIFGWTAEETIGHPLPTVPPEKSEEFAALRQHIILHGSVTGLETTRQRRDGSQVHVRISIAPYHDADGKLIGIMSMNEDITEQMRIQAERQQSHQRIAEILESISDAFYALDNDWRFTYVNRKAEQLWGKSRETLIGGRMWDMFPRAVGSHSYQQHLLAAQERQTVTYETVSPIIGQWIEVSIFPSANGLSVYFRDITHRKRVEQELEQRTRELEGLVTTSQILSSELRLDQLPAKVTQAFINSLPPPIAASLWLYDTEEERIACVAAAGVPDTSKITGAWVDVSEGIVGTTYRQGTMRILPIDQDAEIEFAGLEPILEGFRTLISVPLITRDRVLGVIIVLNTLESALTGERDIRVLTTIASQAAITIENADLFAKVVKSSDQMRQLSEQVLRAQEAERLRVSRELHDELGQGLLLVKLDLELIKDRLPPTMVEFQHRLEESIRLTERVTEEMRTLSMDLRPSILDDLGLEAALNWYVRRFEESTGLSVFLSISDIDQRLPSDIETAVFRCIQETLTNVAKHAQATVIDIIIQKENDRLRVQVTDNGIGFDPEVLTGVGTTSHRGQGLSGLRGRVALLGGHSHITSSPGTGTQIGFDVPLHFSH